MSSVFYGRLFGEFLAERGRFAPSRLAQGLEEQGRVNRPLGALAIERGLMTPAQVEEVVRLQRTRGGRFGEIALALGRLSVAQLDGLLLLQAGSHLYLGEWLVRERLLDYAQLDALLRAFHADNGRCASILEPVLEASGGPWAAAAAGAFVRLLARGMSGTARIVRADPPSARLARPGVPPGALAICARAGSGQEEVFSLAAVLPRRTLLALVYCLQGRQTLDERLIREILRDFVSSAALAVCLARRTDAPGCEPQGTEVYGPGELSGEVCAGAVRLALTTSIGECVLFVRGARGSGV